MGIQLFHHCVITWFLKSPASLLSFLHSSELSRICFICNMRVLIVFSRKNRENVSTSSGVKSLQLLSDLYNFSQEFSLLPNGMQNMRFILPYLNSDQCLTQHKFKGYKSSC